MAPGAFGAHVEQRWCEARGRFLIVFFYFSCGIFPSKTGLCICCHGNMDVSRIIRYKDPSPEIPAQPFIMFILIDFIRRGGCLIFELIFGADHKY